MARPTKIARNATAGLVPNSENIYFVPGRYQALANDVTVSSMSKIASPSGTEQRFSPEVHLTQAAEEARADAAVLPPGPERDALLRQARRSETAAHMNDWINSPGLKPPE